MLLQRVVSIMQGSRVLQLCGTGAGFGLYLSVQLDNLLRRGIGNPELCMIKQQRVCTESSSCNTSCTRCKNGTTQACWILLA